VEINKKAAPQRRIQEITRSGEYGNVLYHHKLDCGHTEVRSRKSVTPKIACSWCVVAANKANEIRELTNIPAVADPETDFIQVDDDQMAEVEVAVLRAGLAAKFDVPAEAVEVVTSFNEAGYLDVNYVVVFLDKETAIRLVRPNIIDIPTPKAIDL
jgi:hypothetical protein